MKKFICLPFFLLCVFFFSKESYSNVYASGLKISDDTCSTYANAGSTWDGNFTNGGVKIWFIINEAGGSAGSLTASVRVKQGSTVVRTLNVTSPLMGVNSVIWDGNNDASAPVSAASYSFEVYVTDAVGHTNFDSLWIAGANTNGSKDFDGGTSFPYRGNASITDQTQTNFGNIYVARGTSSANGFYELRADGYYNQKIGTSPAWPGSVPTEVATLGGKVYGLAGYGYSNTGFAKSFNSSTNTFADSIGFGTTNIRSLAIRVVGADTLFYTCRSGLGVVPSIFVRKGVYGDTSMFVDMSQYILSGNSGYLKALATDDSGNVYVAYGNTSGSRKKLAKFNSAGALVFADSLDGKYGLASTATFSSLAISHGTNLSSNADDKLYALVYSGTVSQWGIYSFNLDGSSAAQLVSPLGCSSAATSELINTDVAGNVIWSNGSTSERIVAYSPASGPNSFTTQSPTGMNIVVAVVLPVELTSFIANLVDNKVSLSWSTVTEINNSRFEIEKKIETSEWIKIGTVNGSGTSTKNHSYSFVDSKVDFVKATYRIKQIDLNGSYSYSKEVEINASAPVKFELNQNYPNPFNPTTLISYSIQTNSFVRLEVYSVSGQRVKVLVNSNQEAGSYNLTFDGSSLASGVYIYRLTAGEFVVSKKMQLLK